MKRREWLKATLGALVLSLLAAVLGAMTGRRHSREVRPTP